MYEVKFTPKGSRDLKKLPEDLQKRIIKKLEFFASQEKPTTFSKPLVNLPPSTHRFRVGDYRIAFYVDKANLYVERIGHRREVYYFEIKSEK